MTVDPCIQESQRGQTNATMERKRQLSGDVCGVHGPKMVIPDDKPMPTQSPVEAPNGGWGMFKDRETFVEMHLC